MARNPVTAVRPVDPVGPVRRVDSGVTYFRHLELWRINSEFQAAERRRRLRLAQGGSDDEFAQSLRDSVAGKR
ncbi:MAG: hypothetical protein JO174_07735 [Herbaspirillum sp.]|nr:hypothetical protein [Herbaspirillum sp.]